MKKTIEYIKREIQKCDNVIEVCQKDKKKYEEMLEEIRIVRLGKLKLY